MRKARIALARRLAIIMHAMLRHGTEFKPASQAASAGGGPTELPSGAMPQGGVDDGADSVACDQLGRLRFQPSRSAPSSPHRVPQEHVENAGTRSCRYR